jgi:hypothetical protein
VHHPTHSREGYSRHGRGVGSVHGGLEGPWNAISSSCDASEPHDPYARIQGMSFRGLPRSASPVKQVSATRTGIAVLLLCSRCRSLWKWSRGEWVTHAKVRCRRGRLMGRKLKLWSSSRENEVTATEDEGKGSRHAEAPCKRGAALWRTPSRTSRAGGS